MRLDDLSAILQNSIKYPAFVFRFEKFLKKKLEAEEGMEIREPVLFCNPSDERNAAHSEGLAALNEAGRALTCSRRFREGL